MRTATDDKAIAEKIMNQPVITDIFPEPTYDELEKALTEWMNPENADSDVAASTEEETSTPAKTTTPKASVNKVEDVASAFNDLFN